jgi:hypothetical protein
VPPVSCCLQFSARAFQVQTANLIRHNCTKISSNWSASLIKILYNFTKFLHP